METKAYQLVLSPDLDLSPSEIVAAWNADAQASAVARVHLVPSEAKQFDPTLLEGIVTLVSTVGVGILTNAIYDVLKVAAANKRNNQPHKRLKITQLDQPDGTHLLVIEQEEA
jgi:hypothetical protein